MTENEIRAHVGLWMLTANFAERMGEEQPTARRVSVTGGDYVYIGWLVGLAKKRNGVIRVVVEDENRRLFIHNADQVSLLS